MQTLELNGMSMRWRLDRKAPAIIREVRKPGRRNWKVKGAMPLCCVVGRCKCSGPLMRIADTAVLLQKFRICWKCSVVQKEA